MSFYQPFGLLALFGVIWIIVLYLMKQKYKQHRISSLFLWELVLSQTKSQAPWQKLQKNLLFLLQILIVCFFSFALSKPFFLTAQSQNNLIFVLDQSASMQTMEGENTRFDLAKQRISEQISTASPQTAVSIIAMGQTPYLALSNTVQKNIALDALKKIPVTYASIDVSAAIALAKMEQETTKGLVQIYTDTEYDFSDVQASIVPIGTQQENCAITMVTPLDNTVLVKVANFGTTAVQRDVFLHCNREVWDTKPISIEAGQTVDCYFTVPEQTVSVMASLSPNDALAIDDIRYAVIQQSRQQKVLLITQGNIFLEKALSLMDTVQLYKIMPSQYQQIQGYDLYIFDGYLPEELPIDGHLICINPPEENKHFPVDGQFAPQRLEVADTKIFAGFKEVDFAISTSKKLLLPSDAILYLSSMQQPLIYVTQKTGQKSTVIGFDLHESDFPLKKEFPLFVYQLIEDYFPVNTIAPQVLSKQPVEFSWAADAKEITVTDSLGTQLLLAPPFPPGAYQGADIPGIYTLEQSFDQKESRTNIFSVNCVTEGESNLVLAKKIEGEEKNITLSQVRKNIVPWICFLLLIVLAIEWWVNCREAS